MPIAHPARAVAIEAIEMRVLHIPMVAPFTTSFGTESVREVIVVRALTDGGEGWGEVVTMNAPLYSSEYTQGAWDVITSWLGPALLRAETIAPHEVSRILAPYLGHRMAKAGLELAILDAALRAEGRSFASYAGAVHSRIPSGVSVGIQDSPTEMVDRVAGYLEEGYVRIKIKIAPGHDVADTRAVRLAFPGISLQVDANSAYSLADADLLAELDDLNLLLIEQPLAEDDLVDHAALARLVTTPICLDESIVSAKAAADALTLGSASIINIKAGRVGGYLEAIAIHDLCLARGIAVWCGGMVETGIGRAANAALAALPGFTLPGDVSGADRFYPRDIVREPIRMREGHVAVPTGPGLGIEVDHEALESFTVARTTLRRE